MKTKCVFLFLLTGVMSFQVGEFAPCFAQDAPSEKVLSDKKREVRLVGSLKNKKLRSLFPDPVSVMQSSNTLCITFLEDLSNVCVEIADEAGEIMHYDLLSPFCGAECVIDLSGWDNGIYRIVFSTEEGGCLCGEFERMM